MRPFIFVALILLGTLTVRGQTAVELDAALPYAFAFSSAVFTDDGNHLIVGTSEALIVFESETGKRIYRIPLVHDKRKKAATLQRSATLQRTAATKNVRYPLNLSIAFGGKSLVAGNSTFRLIDIQKLVTQGRLDEIKLERRGGIFIDSFGSNGLIFLSRDPQAQNPVTNKSNSLLVYKLVGNKLNDVASVDLGPGLVLRWDRAVHTYHATQLVLGRADQETGFVHAIRCTPDVIAKFHTIFDVARPSTCQFIDISWDDRGYGKLVNGKEMRLPFLPSSFDAELENCTGPKYHPHNKKFYVDAVQHASLTDSSPQIQRIRVLNGQYDRHNGLELAQWSGDGKHCLVNDCHDTAAHRDTIISVHDASGRVVAKLPTGKAHNAYAIAVSKDGRYVLTTATLTNRAASKSPSIAPSRRKPVPPRLQLWKTGL